MRVDRILAVILIAASLVAAIGSWVIRPRPATLEIGKRGAMPLGGTTADVGVFDLIGAISYGEDDGPVGGSKGISSSRIVPLLRKAEKDGVKAILLRINSPGGTAAASQAIFEELMRIRKAGKIKIVAAFGDVAASGGYYIGAAADHIVSLPGTTTGSIGVIAHAPNIQGLMQKIGVQDQVIKSGPHKDILSPTKPMDPAERAILQSIVDDTYRQFLDAVARGRTNLPMPKLRPLADGRIYTGQQALKAGLVDSLGNFEDALKKTASLAGIKGEPTTLEYTEQSIFDYFLKLESRLGGGVKVEMPGTRSIASRFPTRVPLTLWE